MILIIIVTDRSDASLRDMSNVPPATRVESSRQTANIQQPNGISAECLVL